ncbi:MAG: high frequency lysogenization protein HflD [Lysobacterales bacterium]
MAQSAMRDRVIALAGVFQASELAHDLADRGHLDETALNTSIESLYRFDAANATEVYGDLSNLELGLHKLRANFSGRRNPNVLHGVVSLLQLAGKVLSDNEMSENLNDGLQAISVHRKDPEFDQERHFERLAQLYVRTISTLKPRVIVRGNPVLLQQDRYIHGVRACLLTGIRSAVLWRQLGGTRWQLILRGRTVLHVTRELLGEI